MMYICYNSQDITFVSYIIQELKYQGIDFWFDRDKLLAGDLLSGKIDEGLKKSVGMLVCIGKNGITDWQTTEIDAAFKIYRKNKSFRIIPVLLPGSNEELIHINLQSFLWVDFRNGFENKVEWKRLFTAIKGKVLLPKIDSEIRKAGVKKPVQHENKRAVCIALLYKDELLIIQRSDTQKSGRGLWQIPFREVNENETPILVAISEIEEGAGILLNEKKLIHITELVDSSINNPNSYITTDIYLSYVNTKKSLIATEFQNSKWIKLSDIFSDDSIIYFGSTGRYLRIIRRYINVHLPLKEISRTLLQSKGGIKKLPTKLNYSSSEGTQAIYGILSLLGFLSDKENFTSSSTLSVNLIKMLSEWALSEKVIFDADGDQKWHEEIEKKGNVEEVERFRAGLFDEHKNILGLLSYRFPKALSTRHVCGILLTAFRPENQKTYLLIRWDLFAKKYQVPAKGLEELNSDITSIEAPHYTVKERFSERLINTFEYQYYGKVKTTHVGAGSLGDNDGPVLRDYVIAVFNLLPKRKFDNEIIDALNQINLATVKLVEENIKHGIKIKKPMNFYLWVDLEYLELKRTSLLEKKLQGYDEIVKTFKADFLKENRSSIILESNNLIPIISETNIENSNQLDLLMINAIMYSMQDFWSKDLFFKAFNYAAIAHNNQKIPGSELPYITHIASVCIELMAIIDGKVKGDFMLQCAALHDTIEDTKINYEDLLKEFGKEVADGVMALSKNYNLDKEAQIKDSISRTLLQPKEIWMVKMADRITNLNTPPAFWNSEKIKSYHKQSQLIYNSFKSANLLLSSRLKLKINNYKKYF